MVLFSSDPDADRLFFRDVLGYPFVDAGRGWLIFALPPAELAVHPSETDGQQQMYLMCDNIDTFIAEMSGRGIACSDVRTERWGRITDLRLPGGGALGVYEPTHPSPI